ncbi:ATP-dependent DNA ligase family profile domain-containing protein [Madurella fahalii]|uniref:ATP-dependent DNA ligase family profile domain-containing protein n=1 Tax=Madurella fahalii TaxID=1157608 RepID=A0ABQ0G984_9PEZI
MPFLFSYVCDLLQRLDDNRLARSGLRSNATIIQEWFKAHQALLYRDDHDTAALLSALLPEKRTDRVYFIREKKLQTVIGRALGLGRSRIAQLARWSNPEARTDLAESVESILRETPNPIFPSDKGVTVEEIDKLLHAIASTCRFSSPAVRSSASENRLANQELELGELYRRLSARDAKWLTRLILKNYEPVIVDQRVVCQSYHPLLPAILDVQDDLAVAGRVLDSHKSTRKAAEPEAGMSKLAETLKPTLGVKIGRQPWIKGRSINHCLSMIHGRISCEEKMDGEYCQIHIDLSKGYDCIQIFSKSGKDSTRDRFALHDSIRKSLQLGQPSCPLKKGCILEGELVVYSDKHSKILDFHKIRKHVSRSGSFLGTDQDSQPHPWEHLMIVYYDVLMVDDESLLLVKHSERFQRLKDLITPVAGRSALVKRDVIDCGRRSAASDLRRAFAKCITARGEGLVLKMDDPYFDWGPSRRPYSCCAIKLKKEYIGNFGDIGDFAVVGARFDAARARTYNIPRLKWTHFYVGCLENKDEVRRFGKQPRFVVTNVVELNATQLEAFIFSANPEYVPTEKNTAISLRIEPGIDNGKRPSVIFPTPPVVDLRCFSFDKEGNTGFWSPRFPSVTKIHCDRTYRDALSFAELQDMAVKEKEVPPPDDSQELLGWIAALENSELRVAGDETSQSTASTATAPVTPCRQSSQPGRQGILSTPTSPTAKGPGSTREHQAIPVGRQPMTPKSSAIQAPGSTTSGLVEKKQVALGQKRPYEASSQNNTQERMKTRRCSSDHISTFPSSQRLIDTRASPSRRHSTANLPMPRLSTSTSMRRSYSENKDARAHDTAQHSVQASQSFQGILASMPAASPPPSTEANSASTGRTGITAPQLATIPRETNPGRCRYLPESCELSTYSFLLSPCISHFPWVTENLLSVHGVTNFIQDPKAWLKKNISNSSSSTAEKTGRRQKKIVLVDARRIEATDVFLRSIQDTKLTRRNGEREYVPIFDWRVLETLVEEERRCKHNREKPGERFDLASGHGVWRRFWVGLA